MIIESVKILFVCKHNRFRSKVAEAFFNKYNKNEKNEVKSAGIALDFMRPYVAEDVYKILEDMDVKIGDTIARKIDEELIRWSDKIIIVADNVEEGMFGTKDVEVWKVEDCGENDVERIRGISVDIGVRVKKLVDELK